MKNKKEFFGVLFSVLISVFLVFLGVYATTTVGDDITVGDDLIVTEDVSLTGNDIGFANGASISNAADAELLTLTETLVSVVGKASVSSSFYVGSYASVATDLSVDGDLAVDYDGLFANALQVGNTATAAYSRFGNGTTGHSLADNDDLLITGLLEVDDTAYFDGVVSISNATTGIVIDDIATGIQFTGEATSGFIKGGAYNSFVGSQIAVADNTDWNGIQLHVDMVGASGREDGSAGEEDNLIYARIENSGKVYYQRAIMGRSYVQNGGTTIENYGLWGRARLESGGTIGDGGTTNAALIGVMGEADVDSGGTINVGGGGVAAGGRFIITAGDTITGYSTAVMGQVISGTVDSGLYLLQAGTANAIIEVNNSGTTSDFVKFRGSETTIASATDPTIDDADDAAGFIRVSINGTIYYIPIYLDEDVSAW